MLGDAGWANGTGAAAWRVRTIGEHVSVPLAEGTVMHHPFDRGGRHGYSVP